MRKIVLEYIDLPDDRRRILGVLAENSIEVIDATSDRNLYQYITIRVKSTNELNWILGILDRVCEYGVKVVK